MLEQFFALLPLPEPSPALIGQIIGKDIAQEKRRLEKIARDAGASRSMAKAITAQFFTCGTVENDAQ